MRRIVQPLLVALILSALIVSVALAAEIVADDTVAYSLQPDTNFDSLAGLLIESDAQSGPSSCDDVVALTYLRFDLSTVNIEVSSTTTTSALVLEAFNNTGSGNVNVYSVSDDWNGADAGDGDETTLTWNNAPVSDSALTLTPLASTSTPDTSTGDVTVSLSSAALNDYINQQSSFTGGGDATAGDDLASFVLAISDCGSGGSVEFYNREAGDASAPTLDLYSPTAVAMQSIRTDQGSGLSTTTVVVALLALMTVALVAALSIRRKETIT